jgi:phosphoglycolate phosphatase-like HAD superfamily hydrolase
MNTGDKTESSSFIPHPSSLRILLWDLDGTLVHSRREGAYKDYTAPMLEGLFGTAGALHQMRVSGMTDLQIVAEALRGEGITHEHISSRKEELIERYITEMRRATANGHEFVEAIPGARETLQAVHEHPRYLSGLLTGNIEPAAYLKLEIAGLAEFFTLPGAFGNESFDRRDLPAIAVKRINEHLGANFPPEHFIVIGDTPNDIACARHFGAKSVAVATGRMNSAETLLPYKPDALLPDLSDVELVMRTLERL